MKKTKQMRYRLYTYDLWSDGEGGLSVNDVYQQGVIEITAHLKTWNPGTPFEKQDYDITDIQLNRAIGARGFQWDGEQDYILFAIDKKGNPACELRRIEDLG